MRPKGPGERSQTASQEEDETGKSSKRVTKTPQDAYERWLRLCRFGAGFKSSSSCWPSEALEAPMAPGHSSDPLAP